MAEEPTYPHVGIVYSVQYQTRREPGIWWDANADQTSSLDEALAFAADLKAGRVSPRGNPRAYVTKTRVAQTVSTTTIIQGEQQ